MVAVEILVLEPQWSAPSYARAGDAGADLRTTTDVVIAPGERVVVGTGIAMAIPDGFVGMVHPRSGLAANHGLSIVNSPGVIDSGYRGEIKVALINHDLHESITLNRGDRIAQIVIQEVSQVTFVTVDSLSETERGAGGYGSTGTE